MGVMLDKNVSTILIASAVSLVIGLALGFLVGSLSSHGGVKSPENASVNTVNLPIDEVKAKVSDFVSYKLVKPGITAELTDAKEEKEFYRFNFTLRKDGSPVADISLYTTKDGKYLILNLIKLPEKIEKREVNVTKTQTPQPEINIDIKNEPYKGNKNAKVTIVEFSDYACPFCARFATQTLPKIMKNFDVRFVYKDFPLPMHGEAAVKAHEAANCALEQGKYWQYHDILFQRQAEWKSNTSKFLDYAKALGMNVTEFKECLDSDKYRQEILEDRDEGMKLGVRGTPTFFINGKKISGALPYEEFARVIREVSAQ